MNGNIANFIKSFYLGKIDKHKETSRFCADMTEITESMVFSSVHIKI